jgi:hypothetical protein
MSAVNHLTRRSAECAAAIALVLIVVATTFTPMANASSDRPYFSVARNLWLSEFEMVSSALQNVPLVAAVHDLKLGLSMNGAETSGYAAAITTIEGFERIPITSETSGQMAASHRDVSALNAFFGLTSRDVAVLMNEVPSGPYYNAARIAFDAEPAGIGDGVAIGALANVVADLQHESVAQSSRSILYTSAIGDARSLEGASAQNIATSERTLLDPYNQDIYYLNTFFRTMRLQTSTAPQ